MVTQVILASLFCEISTFLLGSDAIVHVQNQISRPVLFSEINSTEIQRHQQMYFVMTRSELNNLVGIKSLLPIFLWIALEA